MNNLDIRQFFFTNSKRSLENIVHHCIPKESLPHQFQLQDIIGRYKDGGAIVKFGFKSADKEKTESSLEIVKHINNYLSTNRTLAPYNFQPVRSFLVKGHPFLEDMVSRFPSLRIRIEFQGEPINIEKLYGHLRTYGRIYDIAAYPNPTTGKDPARYAIVQFTRIRSATSARTCLHGCVIGNTRLNILYESQLRTNVVKEFVQEHPKIAIPFFAAIIAGITYAIFDPLREFCIISKITQRFNPEEYRIYRWLRRETWAKLVPVAELDRNAWADDPVHLQKLQSWFREKPETFIIVSGPSGSGKSELVKAALENRKNKLVLDCEELVNARNRSEVTKILAKQVGYFPVFTWIASLSTLLETVVAATTGQPTGLSTTPESMNKDILEMVGVAIADLVPLEKKESARRILAKKTLTVRIQRWLGKNFGTPEQKEAIEELEADDEIDNFDPRSVIPVVFIDGFMKDTPNNQLNWNDMAEWAALLVKNEIAHVVFVSSNVESGKVLAKALPGKSFSSINLMDAPKEVAYNFLSRHLGMEKISDDIEEIVDAFGGRLNELEQLVQKIKLDITPKDAFNEIVQRNVIEVRKYGFGELVDDEDYDLDWSVIQFWEIVKLLAEAKTLNYDEMKWGDFFDGKDKPIRAMEHADLINILHYDGRPNSIRPAKPIYYTVFKRLTEDTVFAASMEIETFTFLKKEATEKLTKIQDEILSLSQIYNGKPPREIDHRVRYLLSKVKSLQSNIEEYEKKIKHYTDIVSKSWVDTYND
ncbi:unnamed protein product [Cunninghamella echinulata]